MSFYHGMTCENVTLTGDKGTPITAYVARPAGPGPFLGVVLIHHLPGWSERTSRQRAGSPITAISRSAPTSMSARAVTTPTLTTSPPRCAPRAASPTPRWSATPRPP